MGITLSTIPILLFGAIQILHPRPLNKPAEARSAETRSLEESDSREINLARYVFSEEELAERRAARQGRSSVQSAYRLVPLEDQNEGQRARQSKRHERTMSRAYLYRDKNAWNRDDVNGDGTRWGSKHPRSLSLPFHPIVGD